jgi:hypothetical protein
VERSRDIAHSSVELKLSFGDDTRLSVRVELRNGAIQATFRTDSTELRQALANGWRQQAPAVVATASQIRSSLQAQVCLTPRALPPAGRQIPASRLLPRRQNPPLRPLGHRNYRHPLSHRFRPARSASPPRSGSMCSPKIPAHVFH